MKDQGGVSSAGWRCIEAAAGLLVPLEREVVLGDLAETDRGVWRGRRDLRLSLVWALFLAAIATLAPLMSGKGWMLGFWLLWPGWYLAATARRKQA